MMSTGSRSWGPRINRRELAVIVIYPIQNEETGHTYRPLRKRKILQQRRISRHLDNVAISLKPNHMHGFSATPLHKAPELSSFSSRVATSPFSNDNRPIPGKVIKLVE